MASRLPSYVYITLILLVAVLLLPNICRDGNSRFSIHSSYPHPPRFYTAFIHDSNHLYRSHVTAPTKHYHWVSRRFPHRNTPQTHPQLSPHADMITLRPRTAFEQANTKVAIEAGIAEANNQDHPVLAAVLRQLYEESLHYHVRADSLDAVITGNATEQQVKNFVSYIEATMNRVEEKDKAALNTGRQKTTDRR